MSVQKEEAWRSSESAQSIVNGHRQEVWYKYGWGKVR